MATQVHVSYSATFMGIGFNSGSPYWCAQGNAFIANGPCVNDPDQVIVSVLTDQTDYYDSVGLIDPVSNLNGTKVYIFHGLLDSVTDPGMGTKTLEYYQHYVNPANIEAVLDRQIEHTFPTMNYGNPCDVCRSPYMSDCDYDGSYAILNRIYGGTLEAPSGPVTLAGVFYEFDQTEFFPTSTPSDSSMDDIGLVYVPSGCVTRDTPCRLHVVFHGCDMGRYTLGDEFARNAGYNEVGELNNIIVLYPQAVPTPGPNLYGCWDWWGYTNENYATKIAEQSSAVYRMVEKMAFPVI